MMDRPTVSTPRLRTRPELRGSALADPAIPNVMGEPGATFVFSQILGINDDGIAVGYYGDSTGSQHGFLYNTNTGHTLFWTIRWKPSTTA